MDFQDFVCEKLIRLFPAEAPNPANPHLWEIFKNDAYLYSSRDEKRQLHISTAQASYDYESNPRDSWLIKYFSDRVPPEDFSNSVLLDLGSYCGGRLTYWTEQFSLRKGLGIDINPIFKVMSEDFASYKGIQNIHFRTGFGEALPYDDSSIDFIVSTDVLEHVADVKQTLSECYRVLKDGGRMLIVFPQYLQPLEAHLGMFTTLHGLHWIFPGNVIAKSIYRIYRNKPEASWYLPEFPLRKWERLFDLNGTSVFDFRQIVKDMSWKSSQYTTRPIFTDGRRSNRFPYSILRFLFWLPAHLPFLEELFLGRINVVLTK